MSEFLKNLNEALANKVYIDRPAENFATFYKSVQIEKFQQFVCTPTKNLVCLGPGISNEDLMTQYDLQFGILHITKLVELISEFSNRIKFVPLILPSHCEQAQLHRHKNIYGRIIEDYIPMTDNKLARWDFLVEKLD